MLWRRVQRIIKIFFAGDRSLELTIARIEEHCSYSANADSFRSRTVDWIQQPGSSPKMVVLKQPFERLIVAEKSLHNLLTEIREHERIFGVLSRAVRTLVDDVN